MAQALKEKPVQVPLPLTEQKRLELLLIELQRHVQHEQQLVTQDQG